MILSKKTLEKLRQLINEETEYRSGPKLVQFFNELGFSDKYAYGGGFPSRWIYTDEKLNQLNGRSELDICIKQLFAPVNYIGKYQELDKFIDDFNQYLAFDKWRVVREGADVSFKRLEKVEINEAIANSKEQENEFLKREFTDIPVSKLGLESAVVNVLEYRIREIEKCFSAEAPLATIMLAGSTLEGILLGLANQFPREFNSSSSAPKDSTGKAKHFPDWTLGNLIDVAREQRFIEHDTHKFSHSLRDFRNFIHPFEQLTSGFSPRTHTAKLCLQVLKSAIHDITEQRTTKKSS